VTVPNDHSIVRLVRTFMLEQNDEWIVGRRCMSLKSLAPVSENPHIRLPGMAA